VSRRATKKHDVSELYSAVQRRHQSDAAAAAAAAQLRVSAQHDCLRPRLRDYQKTAVLWMLTKECYESSGVDELSHGQYSAVLFSAYFMSQVMCSRISADGVNYGRPM